MDGYITWKKIIAIALVFILSASIFSFYNLEKGKQNLGQNFSIVVIEPRIGQDNYLTWNAFVYNQFGKPVPNLSIEFFGEYRNTTNEYGCSNYKLRLLAGISMPPGQIQGANSAICNFSFSTIFGTHKFNSVSCEQYSAPKYFSAMVQSQSDPSEPAIMIHYFSGLSASTSNYTSCATLSCYKSNQTIPYGYNPGTKLLGTYQNFTNIIIPISNYLKTNENYQFIAGGTFTQYYFINSSEVTNLTDIQKNYNQIIWNDIFQAAFITSIIMLTGIFFTQPKIKTKKGEPASTKESILSLKEPITHTIILTGAGLLIGLGSIMIYSFYTHTEPFAAYPISIIIGTLFLTGFMAILYSIGSTSNNPEGARKLIMVLSTIIEIAWIIIFTFMEIIFDGSKNVFSQPTSAENSILSSIQFFNPLQYSILIIEALTHLMIIPTALAQYIAGYDYIFVIAGSIISLISVMYVYIRRMEDSYFE